ncbi:MAG: ABC transporter substrate-binding protein [Proteobacteria bacterium]|nr:ABC transporter substrate-binding protein [Pseudomonadota bacterium]MBU0965430.1 ABC transporter substrate-binding protein [Pseudomonadota bacterium]
MMHTRFLRAASLIIVFFLLSVLLPACKQTPEPIKIGLVINLSGRGGMAGEHIRDGALLAVREVNEGGGINGRPLILLVRDDENNKDQIKKVDQSLINEGVVAIVGHSYSANTITAYPLVTSRNTLLITGYTATNKLSGQDDLFLRTSVDCTLYGQKTAELFNLRQVKSLAVIMDMVNPGFALDYVKYLKEHFSGTVTEVRFTSKEDEDWPRIIGEVIAAGPDMVLSLAEASVTGLAAQKLRKEGYSGPLAASIWAQDPTLLDFGGKAVDNMSIVTFIPEENSRPAYLAFADRLQLEFKEKANARSARSYELIMILADALKRCPVITAQELKRQLLAKKYETLLGEVQFDQYGDVIRTIYEVVVSDGHFRTKGVI